MSHLYRAINLGDDAGRSQILKSGFPLICLPPVGVEIPVTLRRRCTGIMEEPTLTKRYYFVSDLHMGGDGQLQHCDYTDEFVKFLKELAQEGPDTELLIVGDTFGFWELTLVHGLDKLDHIIRAHKLIFDQLRATGASITVTMMVGNHDYDLACDPGFASKLRAYNIHLDTSLHLIRTLGDRKIWIEHGQQRDEFNTFREYGNLYALPVGYFITETFVSGASRHSDFGTGAWLKDIRSVGTMQIPDWILSNYFYREMSTALRWFLLPFLLLSGVTILAIVGESLRILGIFDYNILFQNPLMSRLGIIDNVLQVVIAINSIFLVLFGLPMAVVSHDLTRTLRRFRVLTSHGMPPDLNSVEPYLKGAQEVFERDDKVAVFVFGHTHDAFLKRMAPAGRVVLNTGTWLKGVAPSSGSVWIVARCLLSLVPSELFPDRRGRREACHSVRYDSEGS